MDIENIEAMKNTNIKTIDKSCLVDIKNVSINPYDSPEKKMKDYIKQIKNPYCFLCGGYAIKLEFSDNNRTIEDCFSEFINAIVWF